MDLDIELRDLCLQPRLHVSLGLVVDKGTHLFEKERSIDSMAAFRASFEISIGIGLSVILV